MVSSTVNPNALLSCLQDGMRPTVVGSHYDVDDVVVLLFGADEPIVAHHLHAGN